MIKIFDPRNRGEGAQGVSILTAADVDDALEQVVQRVTDDKPELMALAEDLRFVKDPAKGEHTLESGYVLVVE